MFAIFAKLCFESRQGRYCVELTDGVVGCCSAAMVESRSHGPVAAGNVVHVFHIAHLQFLIRIGLSVVLPFALLCGWALVLFLMLVSSKLMIPIYALLLQEL